MCYTIVKTQLRKQFIASYTICCFKQGSFKMALKSCDTVHVAKRCRELIPGSWTGDGESSGTSQC